MTWFWIIPHPGNNNWYEWKLWLKVLKIWGREDPLPIFQTGGEAPDARLEVEEEHEGDRDREGGAVHAANVDLEVIYKCFINEAMCIN